MATKICIDCNEEKGKEEFPGKSSKLKKDRCLVCNRAKWRKYTKSDEGKAARRRVRQSDKGKAGRRQREARRKAGKLEQLCNCCDPREREEAYASAWVGHNCYVCGDPARETDHVIPLAAGNPGDALHCIKNFRPICAGCNRVKNARHYPGTEGWDNFLAERRSSIR